MTLPPPRKLNRFIETSADEARATLLWDRVAARLGGERARRVVWRLPAVVLVAAAAAAIALLLTRKLDTHKQTIAKATEQVIEYDNDGSMTFADGSHIRLREEGRVRLEHADAHGVEVTLEQGTVELDVVHSASRSFVVHAGRVDVVDLGTHFVVTRELQVTRVSVEEGRVEVRDTTGTLPPRTIAAGESWATTVATAEPSPSVAPLVSATTVTPPSASAPARAPSAKELLEAADAARVAGRAREAAGLLDVLRRRHRSDPRAGLAAFELGRLRLDTLGDPQGAVEAFDDSIALAPTGSFREDAEARRVEALERSHDPRCREARETYLARYPKGVHLKEVTARCTP